VLSGPFALALAAGMAATVNPCGFAMLPAYLAMFLGEEEQPGSATVGRALAVSATLTAGFVAVFGLFGLAIAPLAVSIERYLPWATIVIGIGLVGMGVALLMGRQLTLHTPKMAKGGTDGGLRSMFLFGVSYAVASLSCTIGPFLAVTSTTLRSQNTLSGIAMFVVYALGMGLVVTALTVAVALAKAGLVTRLRRALPYVNRVSGALLLLAGAYVAWYGWFEVRTLNGGDGSDPIIDRAITFQSWLQNRIVPDQPVIAAVWIAAAIGAIALVAAVRRRRTRLQRIDDPATTPEARSAAEGVGAAGTEVGR
jgi:cytochrome c biogenesis protein CcdA